MGRSLPCDGVMLSLKKNSTLGKEGETEELWVLTEWSSLPLGHQLNYLPFLGQGRAVDQGRGQSVHRISEPGPGGMPKLMQGSQAPSSDA